MALRNSGRFTAADEGKRVVTADGEVVGEVVRTEDGTAYVRPRPELVVGYGSWLTSCWDPDEAVPLEESEVTLDAEGRIQIRSGERSDPGRVRSTE